MPLTRVVAGNWKMHHGPGATEAFFDRFAPAVDGDGDVRVLFFPPTISVPAALASEGRDPAWKVGVQNVHWEDEGAFTGEISASMAAEVGATHVLVGHSERRHVFGESDDDVGRKVGAVLRQGLTPVICVGETLDERRAARVEEVILGQLDAALRGLGDRADADFIVAYEPVWAIGTGETATPEDASGAHGTLRSHLAATFGDGAGEVPILYGGSVKPGNAGELLNAPDVDGVLVGGASLDPDSFGRIVETAAARTE